MILADFTVPGIPRPKGSKRALGPGRMVESSRYVGAWQAQITAAAWTYRLSAVPTAGPVRVTCLFTFPRPRSHYRTGRHATELRDDAPAFHTARPDVDKLIRAVYDAITASGAIWRDDSQVAQSSALKVYGINPGVRITVEAL